MTRQNATGDGTDPAPSGSALPTGDAAGLAEFLATAPPELQEWARRQAQAAGLNAGVDTGPGADHEPAGVTRADAGAGVGTGTDADRDTNRDALAELGEDDLDDDPILPGRAAAPVVPAAADVPAASAAAAAPVPSAVPSAVQGTPAAPERSATPADSTTPVTPAAQSAPARASRPSRHTGPAQLPTAPLVHTPSAEQAARPSAGDPVNPYPVAARKKGISPLVALVLGGGGNRDADAAPTGTSETGRAPVDPQAVADLEAALATDPDNTGTMTSLADLYYATGDYANAARWMDQVVQREPTNAGARTFLGVLHFNQGQVPAAEEQWQAAIAANPDYVEAYYNLGFAYLSSEPPRRAQAEEAWGKVMEISPNSNLADIVRSHLGSMAESGDGSGDGAGGAGGDGR